MTANTRQPDRIKTLHDADAIANAELYQRERPAADADIDRVVRLLNKIQARNFCNKLAEITGCDMYVPFDCDEMAKLMQATFDQKRDALYYVFGIEVAE